MRLIREVAAHTRVARAREQIRLTAGDRCIARAATMRFRRGKVRVETHALLLEPRSLYILDGAARMQWQHAIPKAEALRYSIAMRTLHAAQTYT
jgi:hypothetical protein